MTTYQDLKDFFQRKEYKLIIAADAEPFIHKRVKNTMTTSNAAGGVAVAFEPIIGASHGIYIATGKTTEDKEVVDTTGKIQSPTGEYTLKRLFFSEKESYDYYYGFSNQTLWPLCHVAFERPIFSNAWYSGFKQVNETFASAIKEEIKGNTFIWLNDYQLSLVPKYLGTSKDTVVGLFWHIPWPTWEVFRILPQKKEILTSLLQCDFIGFHRGYHIRNFLRAVERELEARIDLETNKVYYNKHVTTIRNLPMGVDTDVIKSLLEPVKTASTIQTIIQKTINTITKKESLLETLFKTDKIILGVDRLDYTKGLLLRLQAIDIFFSKYPQYIGKATYIGIIAPSREEIPSYMMLRRQLDTMIKAINEKYATSNWQPVNLVPGTFSRSEIMNLYKKADVCLVTPLDDGMNLVSKEFIIASSQSEAPGMLVLSQFAGSAIDLTSALIVNPYDLEEVSQNIKKALEMSIREKRERISSMEQILDERNVYEWAEDFIRAGETAAKENRQVKIGS